MYRYIVMLKSNLLFTVVSGSIMFEGMEMPCPRDSKAYLTELYGYLGKDCFYNTETQKYEKR